MKVFTHKKDSFCTQVTFNKIVKMVDDDVLKEKEHEDDEEKEVWRRKSEHVKENDDG